ncbi:MAG: hypothetical protein IKS54_02755 [Erysipelotrichaceae bacterium]|nr:hypothetical protein [Erysipelotrichaceae bacterium]
MSYTAFAQERENNRNRFQKDVGPFEPLPHFKEEDNDLKSAALRFIHNRCEKLNFDPKKEKIEKKENIFLGNSTKAKQIPFNMEMDINRLCLERELESFIDSGIAEDAYNIYYCFLEMFFGHYGKSKKMVELLSEFESNGSSLLMKHRDHYSHSVYVFTLGLAIYETNQYFRDCFNSYYNLDKEEASAFFLKYWGMTSLFHDIGYPFELPFEQVLSYFEVDNRQRGKDLLYLAYKNSNNFSLLSEEERLHFHKLYQKDFSSSDELFSYDIVKKIGKDYECHFKQLVQTIRNKPSAPEKFDYHMDHAYFSANRLYRELVESFGIDQIKEIHIDVLTAIILHNSLYKFAIAFYKDEEKHKRPLAMEDHPLAFLLFLCDELQCWDRTAYGRNSRTELHPMSAEFDFSNNSIKAIYYYDREEKEKIDEFEREYREWKENGKQGKMPRLKAYSDMAEKGQRFVKDIESIVDTSHIPLNIRPSIAKADRTKKHTYLSNSNFLHLYDFAVALNARYNYQGREKYVEGSQLEAEFEMLSLEYQLSNINQAKSFSKYLDELGCFYTDKPVDYPMISSFTKKLIRIIAPMEHERWIREHQSMGWTYGTDYETLASDKEESKMLREQFRQHKLAMDIGCTKKDIVAHYNKLPLEEKVKDYEPFNSMLKLIKKFDGLRIYELD